MLGVFMNGLMENNKGVPRGPNDPKGLEFTSACCCRIQLLRLCLNKKW